MNELPYLSESELLALTLYPAVITQHSIRVGRLCKLMGLHLGFSQINQSRMERAGQWHDAGKFLVPECSSEVQLTDMERERITRAHTDRAPEILEQYNVTDPWILQAAMLHHHDWKGGDMSQVANSILFPSKPSRFLAGQEIPEPARIVRPIDYFVGHMEMRKHRSRIWTVPEVVEKLKADKGGKFDPNMVEIFISACLPEAVRTCA